MNIVNRRLPCHSGSLVAHRSGLPERADDTRRRGGRAREQTMMVSSQEIEAAFGKQYQQMIAEALPRAPSTGMRPRHRAARPRIASRLTPQTGCSGRCTGRWNWEERARIERAQRLVHGWRQDRVLFGADRASQSQRRRDRRGHGHEIAHALREHARERVSRRWRPGWASRQRGARRGRSATTSWGQVAKVTFELPNSRLHETEADRIGVELGARAGYDPRAAVGLWKKMESVSGGQPPQWLSPTPSHDTRQQDSAQYAQG